MGKHIRRHVRTVLHSLQALARQYDVDVFHAGFSGKKHPRVNVVKAGRLLGYFLMSSTPAVEGDEINYARQRLKRILKENGYAV